MLFFHFKFISFRPERLNRNFFFHKIKTDTDNILFTLLFDKKIRSSNFSSVLLYKKGTENKKKVTVSYLLETYVALLLLPLHFRINTVKIKSNNNNVIIMTTFKDLSSNKILGKGGFGIVFEGVWCAIPVAIKRIALSDITSNQREEEALQRLDHPNVIKLLHVENDPMFR